MFAPGHLGRAGLAASGNQNIFGAVVLSVDCHRMGIDQRGPAGEGLNACAFKQLHINAVQTRNFPRPINFKGFPVQRRGFTDPAKTVGFFKTFGEVRRVAVELFRDATEVDAGAAHFGNLGQGNLGAALGSHTRRAHAAAAAANHEKVKVKILHECSFLLCSCQKDTSMPAVPCTCIVQGIWYKNDSCLSPVGGGLCVISY